MYLLNPRPSFSLVLVHNIFFNYIYNFKDESILDFNLNVKQ